MSQQKRSVMTTKVGTPNQLAGKAVLNDGIPQTKRACAGVGTPMNKSLWRVSMLNLASRRAAKTTSNNPNQDHAPAPEAVRRFFITIPGSTPKLTISARESSSLPTGLDTFNIRAAKPSKKSNTQAAHTNHSVGISGFVNEQTMPALPHNKFPEVSELGMCFSMR
jgi:hypothetical protein